MKLLHYLKITRSLNLIFIGLCVWFGGMLTKDFKEILLDNLQLVLAIISFVLIAAAGYVWNDFCDLKIDKINKPLRILPQSLISKKETILFLLLSGFFGIFASLFLKEILAQSVVWLSVVLLYFYSKFLKKLFLFGNITIGILTASSFLLGELSLSGNLKNSIIPAIFAFLFVLAREIVKDVEDAKGDAVGQRKTIPQKYSFKVTQKIISLILIAIILFSILPFFFDIYSKFYLISVFFTVDLVLVKWIFDLFKKENLNFSKLQKMMKFDMLFILFSIWLGKIL